MTTVHILDVGVREVTPPAQPIEFPCTLAQERFWVLDRIDPGTASLNVAVRWQLEGIVISDVVERAFAAIIERHEVLRTAIVERDGVPIQWLAPTVTFKLSVIDLTRLPESDRTQEPLSIGAKDGQGCYSAHGSDRGTWLRRGNDDERQRLRLPGGILGCLRIGAETVRH
jgi:Condensation domain